MTPFKKSLNRLWRGTKYRLYSTNKDDDDDMMMMMMMMMMMIPKKKFKLAQTFAS